jgi:hypothetical protein
VVENLVGETERPFVLFIKQRIARIGIDPARLRDRR